MPKPWFRQMGDAMRPIDIFIEANLNRCVDEIKHQNHELFNFYNSRVRYDLNDYSPIMKRAFSRCHDQFIAIYENAFMAATELAQYAIDSGIKTAPARWLAYDIMTDHNRKSWPQERQIEEIIRKSNYFKIHAPRGRKALKDVFLQIYYSDTPATMFFPDVKYTRITAPEILPKIGSDFEFIYEKIVWNGRSKWLKFLTATTRQKTPSAGGYIEKWLSDPTKITPEALKFIGANHPPLTQWEPMFED